MKGTYRLLALIGLGVFIIGSAFATFAGGDGSLEDPYLVETASQLNNVRNYLDAHFRQIDDIDLSGYSSGNGWQPIGNENDPFIGTYSGNGFKITNLTISRSNSNNIGLFGYASGALISSIRISNAAIIGQDSVGGIIGYGDDCTIAFCFVSGAVSGTDNVGGMVGYFESGKIDESYSMVDVTAEESVGGFIGRVDFGIVNDCYSLGDVDGDKYVGGFVGLLKDDAKATSCYSIGVVKGKSYTGGLIGSGNGTVTMSYWDKDTSGQSSSAGGEGRNTTDMTYPYSASTFVDWDTDCSWVVDEDYDFGGYPYLRAIIDITPIWPIFPAGDGSLGNPFQIATVGHLAWIRNIEVVSQAYHFVQTGDIDLSYGLISPNHGWKPIGRPGQSFNGNYNGDGYTISNLHIYRPTEDYIGLFGSIWCASLNDIHLNNVDVIGRYLVGSLVGQSGGYYYNNNLLDSSITNCSASGMVYGIGTMIGGLVGRSSFTSIENCNSSTNVSGNLYDVGGLVGALETDGSITNCYSTGNVDGISSIGGLVGAASGTSFVEFIGARITDSYSTGIVEGMYGTGGLVGMVLGSQQSSEQFLTVIENCYAIGDVIGTIQDVGGLVGANMGGYIRQSFASGNVSGNASKAGGLVGRNARLYYANNYVGNGGQILDSYALGNVEGVSEVGGLVGANTQINGVSSLVQYSYSTGLVNDGVPGQDIGGLIGSNDGSVSDSYWDVVTSGLDTSDGGDGAMTINMVLDDTMYTNWDFTNTWEMTPYTTYPYLQWQNAPEIHNYPPNGYYKVFSGRTWYWESFPVLWDRDNNGLQAAQEVLDPLTYHEYINVKETHTLNMLWDGIDWSTQHTINFHSTRGYEMSFDTEDEFNLIVGADNFTSENVPFGEEMTIREHPYESWLGYFIPQTQSVFAAFANSIDDIKEIRSEDWGMYRTGSGTEGWIHDGSRDPKVVFGKMYKVVTIDTVTQPIDDFTWSLPTSRESSEPKEKAEFFVYGEEADYESFFIEDIADDEDVLEVAVYAGDECVGASIFTGIYPLEILAYTNETHLEEDISFAVHRLDLRGGYEKIRSVERKDIESGEYISEIIQPRTRRFTIVRLGTGETETEAIVKPMVTLSQNYPNPFVSSSASRSNETLIPFYLSEEREVAISVYNIKGQRVTELFSGTVNAGNHSVAWNGYNDRNQQVGSGIYFYRLETGDEVMTRKMLIVR